MRLPRYTSTTVPRGSGQVRAQNIGALTASSDQALYSGLGAFGRGLGVASEYAFKATMYRQELDDDIESGKATQKINEVLKEKINEAELYDATSDMPLRDDPNYLKVITTMNKDKRDALTQKSQIDFLKKVNTVYENIQSPRVKANIQEVTQKNIGKWFDDIRGKYGEKLNDYQIGELENLAFTSAKNGDLETANKYVDIMDKYELITHQKAIDLKQAVLLQMAESEARQSIQLARLEGKDITESLAEGYKTIDSYREKVTKLSDIQSLTSKIEREFTIMLTSEYFRNEQNKINAEEEAIELIRKPETTAAEIDNLTKNLEDKEREKITKGQIDRARKGPPTTDVRVFNNTIDEFVNSLDNPEIDIKKIINERYWDRVYADKDYDELKKWSEKEYPMSIVPAIKVAVEYGKKNIPLRDITYERMPGGGPPVRHEVGRPYDNERTALYNKAFMSWLNTKIEKGEIPTSDEIISESRVYANLYKNMPEDKVKQGKQVESQAEPMNRKEFDAAMDALPDRNARMMYWRKWYDKAKEQGWLTQQQKTRPNKAKKRE